MKVMRKAYSLVHLYLNIKIKQTCAYTGHWVRCFVQWVVAGISMMRWMCQTPHISQGLFTMMRGNLRQRAWPLTWTWVTQSSSCMKPCEVPGTARASWSLSLSCSCPPGRTTLTTTTRLANPSASIRSSMPQKELTWLYVFMCLLSQQPDEFNIQHSCCLVS